ncbi:e3 ubiquitin- ligase ubr1 [Trichoderma arundinaceum]|uniref:E3 ubiquitin-protein ligase n=1 Tax=Trichoderma arundinaceum TaxID=490622 RepID=A0A395NBD5_TRIAR|nr:e3 ubiquitin- ligase ubr1 [Trichoderma arundinaceum]
METENPLSTQEQQLCQFLAELPARYNYRYSEEAARELLTSLFWSLAGGNQEYMRLLFPEGRPSESLKLGDAQGAVEGAEYTEAARGKRCGHIFKPGEASYMCRTCGTDETCCLCSRCFDATDHTGHMVRIQISVGNSGCCDCGDDEAWKTPLFCTIHSDMASAAHGSQPGGPDSLPEDLVNGVQMTIGRVFDYVCDVISCSPEQLRHIKTKESILKDEETSRLNSSYYGSDSQACTDFVLVLWNDEKHTVDEVRDQIARACRKSRRQANKDAWQTDAVGRSLLIFLDDVDRLIQMSRILEAIRVTVTIRSARDTFREEMCGTLIEWLSDISGCSIGHDNHILRRTICEEVMKPWRKGSAATQMKGLIDDEEEDDQRLESRARLHNVNARFILALQAAAGARGGLEVEIDVDVDDDDANMDDDDDDDDDDEEEDDDEDDENENDENRSLSDNGDDDVMMVDARGGPELDMTLRPNEALEEDEATLAGYPPPPPPPPVPAPAPGQAEAGQAEEQTTQTTQQRETTPSDSDMPEPLIAQSIYAKANVEIPKTPGKTEKVMPNPGLYWLETPAAYTRPENVPPAEDVFQRVRLDWLLLFDLRMWKKVRNDLRALYISTVVQIPEFKRILALRFASLYTTLAQLYLVGDREPDHSIINLSLQMLTTASITAEVIERGNFLTSLLAILYTFLTTRQVGHPWDISPIAVLAFDSGSVTNRRMYHFYQDLKYLFSSQHVQERLRGEPRYLMQFLDLAKLHQGIGPNVRAVVEHVEYEADAWITASLVTRQINLQARNLAEAFRDCPPSEVRHLLRAIRVAAKAATFNSIGADRLRFKQGEIKDEVKFKTMSDLEFDTDGRSYEVVKFVVEKEAISFHHGLHYILSWLIESGRSLPASKMRALLTFTRQELKSKPRLMTMGPLQVPKKDYSPEDYLMAVFDYPLRVCAWLAQIKANMWVRNGISLRHQASTYRGVGQRDVSHHRDIFLLQTALVVCDPARVLASIIDRFGMENWVKGIFEVLSEAQDDAQHLDVVEDMIHLLVVLLSDRTSLIAPEDEPNARLLAMRRDIIHVLCLKPLSFNEICLKLPEKYQESEEFHQVLDEMATFKPPEGVSDVGTFELRQEFIEEIDPYIAHYNKNQREESELAYRKKMAKKTGKAVEEIVFEPKLRPIPSGLFQHLADFTSTGVFAQVIYYSLLYALSAHKFTPLVPSTRLETFLQVVLHLVLLATMEDRSIESETSGKPPKSFVHIALTRMARSNFMPDASNARTIISLLNLLSANEDFKAVHPKIALVLKRLKQKRPGAFNAEFLKLGLPVDRVSTASPANVSVDEERERRKQAAMSRQAKVMAQFQQQQKSFMENQGTIDWGSDLDEDEEEIDQVEDRRHTWKYPAGNCILCQEEADDRRLYGTFAHLNESLILRQTDFQDPDLVREASQTPCSLDKSAEDVRPFGIAQENRKMVEKLNSQGETFLAERQTIGRGFKASLSRAGPVASSCGHLMHYHCFEQYYEAINRRHTHQIARHHPENILLNEFVCPLCKALGNAFIPIVWKGLEESYPGNLQVDETFEDFLDKQMSSYPFGGSKAREVDDSKLPDIYTPSLPGSLLQTMTRPKSRLNSIWGKEDLEIRLSSTLGAPGGSSNSSAAAETSESGANQPSAAGSSQLFSELLSAYHRLRDTLVVNKLETRYPVDKMQAGDELHASDTLVQIVGFSISAVEIQQRGVEVQPGMTLIEKITEQTIAHLRILAETTSAYMTIGGRHSHPGGRIESEFIADAEQQHGQLFMAQYFGAEAGDARRRLYSYLPLLTLDPFIFLVECSYGLVPAGNVDIMHVVRLCYLAEIVKVVFHMGRNMPVGLWFGTLANRQTQDPAMSNFADFALALTKLSVEFQAMSDSNTIPETEENRGFQQPGVDSLEGWYSFVKKYATTFLRKCVLFLHVKYGVDFNGHIPSDPGADELDRLTEALRLPTFDEMCAVMTVDSTTCGWPSTTSALVTGWVKHQVLWTKGFPDLIPSAMVSHPGIFELVGLPRTFDTLIEEATRKKCPTTGKDLTDPVICLFCGELLCSQSTCCQKVDTDGTKIGGAQQHMRRCQRNIGVFLNVRKCSTVYLFHRSGSFTPAPYIDKYGETDPQLRHGRQLFLNQKRYDSMMRATVLRHGVPSLISRKLEAEINNGGWDTL